MKSRYLIFAGHHAAVIDVPRGLSSEGYGVLQDWFAKRTRSDSFSSMRQLRSQEHDVWYHDELAGPNGASFELYKFPDTPIENVEQAESAIRRKFDVVRLSVRYFKKLHDLQAEVDELLSMVEGDKKPEWRVVWVQQPYAHNAPRVVFVRATDESQARSAARNEVERSQGIVRFKIESVEMVGANT